jgi:hypothetical protein
MSNLNYFKLLLLLMQMEDLLDDFTIEYVTIKLKKK